MSKLQLRNFLSLYMYQSQNLIKTRKHSNCNGFHLFHSLCIVLLKLFLLLCFSQIISQSTKKNPNTGGKCIDVHS